MPILSPDRTHFPDNLFDMPAAESADSGCVWSVLRTRHRQEKALSRQFASAEIGFYLPLIGKRSTIRGRPVTSHLPLFPGYVFLRSTPEDRLEALSVGKGRIAQSLPVKNQEALWRDLLQIHKVMGMGLPVQPEDCLAPGLLVEVKGGPLAGLRGRIIRKASHRRFVVAVDFVQKGVSILLDDYHLAPCYTATDAPTGRPREVSSVF